MQHTYAPGDEGYNKMLTSASTVSFLTDDSQPFSIPVKDVTVIYDPSLMACTHDYSCCICRDNHSVMASGIMQPCWDCQKTGWEVRQRDDRSWIRKFFNLK